MRVTTDGGTHTLIINYYEFENACDWEINDSTAKETLQYLLLPFSVLGHFTYM